MTQLALSVIVLGWVPSIIVFSGSSMTSINSIFASSDSSTTISSSGVSPLALAAGLPGFFPVAARAATSAIGMTP
jgi:hypothetical protein